MEFWSLCSQISSPKTFLPNLLCITIKIQKYLIYIVIFCSNFAFWLQVFPVHLFQILQPLKVFILLAKGSKRKITWSLKLHLFSEDVLPSVFGSLFLIFF